MAESPVHRAPQLIPATVAVGLVGLAGGVAGGQLGIWLAVAIVSPVEIEDPLNIFANVFLIIGPLVAIGLGAICGYVVGAVVGPTLVMAILRWRDTARTVFLMLLLQVPSVPLALWFAIVATPDGWGGVWAAALWIGGVVPALARYLASRPRYPHAGGTA